MIFVWKIEIADSPIHGEYLTSFLMRKNDETQSSRHQDGLSGGMQLPTKRVYR